MGRVVCIIQARMGSTRLPGKVLRPILGHPMLRWVVHRLERSRLIDDIVVATTEGDNDTPIAELCTAEGWNLFRGSEDDVLDRYHRAATQFNADTVIRVTSDCPAIDPQVVDYVTAAHLGAAPAVDYTSNTLERTYPRGLDCEVFSYQTLQRAWQDAESIPAREHVTYHIYNHPQQFTLHNVRNAVDYSDHRWTVDTPEDFALITRIYEHFGHGDFRWQEVLPLLVLNPDWVALNRHIEQKRV